jgi:hypothetical protein
VNDRSIWRVLAVLYVCLGPAVTAREKGAAGERLVAIPPCRLPDTRVTQAKDSREQSVRRLNVAADRCGKVVPSVATVSYA